jgi:hypothetical protein
VLGLFVGVLVVAGIVNSFSEILLKALCHVSVLWHVFGVIIIVALLNSMAPDHQSTGYAATSFNNGTPFDSPVYVALIG